MTFLNWEPRYQVGVTILDTQHKGLFDQINALHDAMQAGQGREEVAKTLAFLARYTVEHFQTEEELMRRADYPDFLEHKAIHDELTRQVLDLLARLDKGSERLTLPVMHFLRDWLSHHILELDKRMAPHLNRSGIR